MLGKLREIETLIMLCQGQIPKYDTCELWACDPHRKWDSHGDLYKLGLSLLDS